MIKSVVVKCEKIIRMTASSPEKKKKVSLLRQIAILFIVGVLLIGAAAIYSLHTLSMRYVRTQMAKNSESTASDLKDYISQYPAHDWLLSYWYENYAEMDIEYDADYSKDTKTAAKCRTMAQRHPDFQLEYADTKDVEALDPRDQKLYAEIVYSWLITRIDEMQDSYDPDMLMCVVTEPPYDRKLVLFIAAGEGDVRGNEPGQIKPIGSSNQASADQQKAMEKAAGGTPLDAPSQDGRYLDYYAYLGSVDNHQLLIVLSKDFDRFHQEIDGILFNFGMILLFCLVILAIVCLLMIHFTVLHPLKKIQKSINLYKNTKDSEKVAAKLSEVQSHNELSMLSEDVADMTKEIDSYTRHIEKITSGREKMVTELRLASRIQSAMLPNPSKAYPERHDFEIFVSMKPAKVIGGDFYDFFLYDDDQLCIVIADVSGKGIPAALFMMASKITLSHHIKTGKSPAQIMAEVNNSICSKNPEEMFITVWLGFLDLKTGKMTAVNAGHDYPIVTHSDGTVDIIKDQHGIVLGAFEDVRYKEYDIQLKPGSRLFLYTDGLTEATSVNNEMFGIERVAEELGKDPAAKPRKLLEDMKLAVDRFVGEQEQFDDLTMLCLSYYGQHNAEQ